jgi:hypothetical protein
MAPSKLPGLNPSPCPISCKNRSPSTSLSNATSTLKLAALYIKTCAESRTQHTRRNVHPSPDVTLLVQDLTRKSGTTPYIEEKGWLVRWEIEQLESAVCHLGLNLLIPRAAHVFSRSVIVSVGWGLLGGVFFGLGVAIILFSGQKSSETALDWKVDEHERFLAGPAIQDETSFSDQA